MTMINLVRKNREFELEVDYTWEDRRMGLLNVTINSVTALDDEEDIDPDLFEETITDDEWEDIRAQIKDRSE